MAEFNSQLPKLITGQTTGDLRLVSKIGLTSTNYNISEGRLEIYRYNQWGTVCSQFFFGQLEADAACRQLGFINSTNYGRYLDLGYKVVAQRHLMHEVQYFSIFVYRFDKGDTSGGIWLHHMSCSISSSRLLDCEESGNECISHNYDTAISCLGGKKSGNSD